jgi:uncharacterized SAM-binding protein YcdF (DUF218 family)
MVLLLKILVIPFYPLGLGMVLVTLGLVMAYRQKKYARLLTGAGLGVLYLCSCPFVSRLVIRPLEAPYYSAEKLPHDCSAIVVLGGSGIPMTPPRRFPEINEAGDRLLHAARLSRQGVAPRVITSGGLNVGSFHQQLTEAMHNRLLLTEIGVDSGSVVCESKSRTTADHGPFIASILDSMALPKRIVLVTSASHMIRSEAVFRKHGFTVYPSATDFKSSTYLIGDARDFFPSAKALYGTTAAFHEFYGLLGYKILGKI